MLYQLKQFLKFIFYSIIFWCFAFVVFIVIRYFAIDDKQAATFNSSYKVEINEWIWLVLFLGVLIGIVFGTIEYIFDRYLSKKLNLAVVLLVKSVIYLIFLIFSLSFLSHFIELQMNLELPNESGWWKTSRTFWLVAGYFFFCSITFLFLKVVTDKFGKRQLFYTLIGRYRNPIEQKRIFMFLDLKSSTTIAEELGHYKYSRLIQDCFYDLNRLVGRFDATIYQYVGDEAVLTWPYKTGVRRNNCIDLFFAFHLEIMRKSKMYRKKYGVVPQFKAGVHGGKLIVSEVGSIKKEIAYHGDVINTTARIQSMCNDFDKTFLISRELVDDISLRNKYVNQEIGELTLDGKKESIILHSIERRRAKE